MINYNTLRINASHCTVNKYFQYPGVNIIGRLPGRYTGTREDKMVLIGSHYDTVQTSPGVDDNGSGMTALLQALKLITSQGNKFVFVFFCLFCVRRRIANENGY